MPAANTDNFLKVAQNKGWQVGSGGVPDASTTTVPLVNGTDIPTDTAVIITVDRVDANGTKTPSKMERILGVMSGNNVVNCVRGVAGTAQAHSAGAAVEVVIDAVLWNKLIAAMLVEHGQDGKHMLSAIDGIRYAADAGGDDTYEVTLTPAPTAYYAGMEVNFKPTTANTGACTLNVNGLGAKTIKKNVSSDLATGDILAGQLVKVIYDGTNFQMVSDIPITTDTIGWNTYSAVIPTRSSADDPTYVMQFASVDLTSMLSVGMRVKWTQNSTVRYGIITAISFSTNTLVTLYGGTDYDVDDTATYAISGFYYSTMKAPIGFPLDPTKWQVRVTDSTQRGGTTTASTWTNHGTTNAQISMPIGAWRVKYSVAMLMDRATAGTDITCKVTLSNANNTEWDSELTSVERWGSAVANSADIIEMTFQREKFLVAASKTLLYLNAWNNNGNDQFWNNNLHPMVLEVQSAYL